MKRVESAEITDSLPIEKIQYILQKHPVRLGILYGSYATESTHQTSDIDIAVEFDSIERHDPSYNEVFFGLSADLSDGLETDDIDLLDIHTLSPAVAEAVFEDGVLLTGDKAHAESLLRRIMSRRSDNQSPRERFDTALRKIDEHLGDGSAVPATDGSRGER